MIRSHYIPQFILRNFCLDGKLTYCNLDDKTVQKRNPYSVFSEKGYYPEQLEKNLNEKAEHPFANLYHNKLENAYRKIVLSADELFVIKKYLVATMIRFQYECAPEDEELMSSLGDEFRPDKNIDLNRLLEFNSRDEMFEYVFQFDNLIAPQSSGNKTSDIKMSLWTEMK